MEHKTISADHFKELRDSYFGAVPHTVFTALVWLVSGLWAWLISKEQAIVVFIVAGTFIFPGGEALKKLMGVRNVMSKENTLGQLFMLLAFTIPLSYPLLYLVSRNNIDLFFPSFTILIGAHYLPFVYGYKMPSFGVLSLVLVSAGFIFGVLLPVGFALPAFVTGSILLVFALLHYLLIKRQLV